jgi:hypothetical protein
MSDPDAPTRPRLPDTPLAPLAGGAAVALRAHRQATVLVLLPTTPSAADAAYLRELAAAEPALRGWDGRVVVVLAGAADLEALAAARATLDPLALPLPVVADASDTIARAAGVTAPALVVADQWGEVYAALAVGPDRPWLPVGEIEEWLRFLAVRCGG